MILFVNADKREFIKGVNIKNSLKKLPAGENNNNNNNYNN